jgi:hypothetical protein
MAASVAIEDRWIAVGLSRFQLLAVVTETDPL